MALYSASPNQEIFREIHNVRPDFKKLSPSISGRDPKLLKLSKISRRSFAIKVLNTKNINLRLR